MAKPSGVPSVPRLVSVALIVVAFALLLVVGAPIGVRLAQWLRDLAGGPHGTPSLGVYILAAGFTFIAVLTPLPAEAAALLNGTLFPPVTAFVLTWVAATAGAAASYECGLRLGHRPAERVFGAERLARVKALVDGAGWPTLLALRLSPVMAFTAINWASGILALSRPVFYWTVAVGLVPGTWVFTMAPQLLLDRGSATRLSVIVGIVMLVLFGMTWGKVRKERGRRKAAGRQTEMPPNEPA